MNRVHLQLLTYYFISHVLGCGYTTIRDTDEEARQAELSIIDSLTFAPDLTISNVEYEYIPPPPRRSALDMGADPPQIRFYLTISNIGNADFTQSFVLVFRNHAPPPYEPNSFIGILYNKKGETIPVDGTQEVKLPAEYPYESTSYTFTIVTNPIIQRDILVALSYRVHDPPVPPLSREYRYDNNQFTISLPGSKQMLNGARHSK